MWKFDPVLEDLVFAVGMDLIEDTSFVNFDENGDTDLSLGDRENDNSGVDSGFRIFGG